VRHDFGKVVIERPRSGSSARNAKVRWFGRIVEDCEVDGGFEYEGPTRIPGSAHAEGFLKSKIEYKRFTDVLGPVKGYLRSSVGRLWNKVYAELSQALGRGTWPVRHILEQHVDVSAKTYRGVDGAVWELSPRGPRKVVPSYRPEFYVEPETGILRVCPKQARDKRQPSFRDLNLVKADGDRWFARIGNVWYLGEYVVDSHEPASKPRFTKLKTCSKKEIRDLLKKRNAILKQKYPKVQLGS
jgi:hypothetical protein